MSRQYNEIEFQKRQPNSRAPIDQVIHSVAHAEMHFHGGKLFAAEAFGKFRVQPPKEPQHDRALRHGSYAV